MHKICHSKIKRQKMEKKILEFHAKRYPLMQPTDAVKLLYQHHFGVGHLIRDSRSFGERLREEIAGTSLLPEVPLTEPIGNGLVRVMLNSPEFSRLDIRMLTDACLATAAGFRGSKEDFIRDLDLLEAACGEHLFAFSPEELAAYLTAYRAEGCPAVSHSRIYRDVYHPAYRVVKESLLFPDK